MKKGRDVFTVAFEEGLFKYLSPYPYLKRMMWGMWLSAVVVIPACYTIGFLHQGSEVFNGRWWHIIWHLIGVVGFGYMFYRWDKYEKERQT